VNSECILSLDPSIPALLPSPKHFAVPHFDVSAAAARQILPNAKLVAQRGGAQAGEREFLGPLSALRAHEANPPRHDGLWEIAAPPQATAPPPLGRSHMAMAGGKRNDPIQIIEG
jgi:hypothetical protein